MAEENRGNGLSTDSLNTTIHVGNIKGYLLIAALTVILTVFLVWCVTGSIPATDTYGAVAAQSEAEGEHLCVAFVSTDDYSGAFQEGTEASVAMPDNRSYDGSVKAMSEQPYSLEEIREVLRVAENDNGILSDWAAANLLSDGNYWYIVEIETKDSIYDYFLQPAKATVKLGEVTPISFLLNN